LICLIPNLAPDLHKSVFEEGLLAQQFSFLDSNLIYGIVREDQSIFLVNILNSCSLLKHFFTVNDLCRNHPLEGLLG